MNQCPTPMANRLLCILHHGWVEARNRTQLPEQEFDLADAMHNIPGFLADWKDEYLELIREDLRTYHQKYPSTSSDFSQYLDGEELPFWPPKWA